MKFTITRAALKQAIDAVHRTVERRNTIPILSNVLIEASPGRVALRATNLDMEAVTAAPAEVATTGRTTVALHTLREIVARLPADAAAVFADEGDGTTLVLIAGRARFQLQSLPSADFPALDGLAFDWSLTVEAALFEGLLARVAFAISTEETRYYLNGIHLHPIAVDGRAGLAAVATDGHRLARDMLPVPDDAAAVPPVIVPRRFVTEAIALARTAAAADLGLVLRLSRNHVRISAGATEITSKLIDGTFPDYQRVIPADNDRHARISRAALADALDRVSTISGERGRATKFSLSGGILTLSVTNPDAGDAREDVPADFAGEADYEIGFNARYVLEALDALGGEMVTVSLGDPGSPALVGNDALPNVTVVVMPMRV